jgi:hypothetical protein
LYTRGVPYRDRAAQREYQRLWLRRRRVAWLLANGPCADCGKWGDGPERVEGLEVDHRVGRTDEDRKRDHRVWSWAAERRAAELAKCDVRCHACHLRMGIKRGQLLQGARLVPEDVIAVRVMARRMSIGDLADAFGVVPGTIAAAVAGRTWRHLSNADSAVYWRARDLGLA